MMNNNILEILMVYDEITFNIFRINYGYEGKFLSEIFSKLLELDYIILYSEGGKTYPPRYRTNKSEIRKTIRRKKLEKIFYERH